MKQPELISLKKFQEERLEQRESQEFSQYLDILSFSELIQEASALKSELERGG